MLSWVIQITIISIVLIFLVHYLINFFKTTLTVPKIKDLVNIPNQKYENMYNIISKNNYNENESHDYTEIDLLPKPDSNSMKNELKNFLKKQLTESSSISTLDSITKSNLNTNSYSDF